MVAKDIKAPIFKFFERKDILNQNKFYVIVATSFIFLGVRRDGYSSRNICLRANCYFKKNIKLISISRGEGNIKAVGKNITL